MSTCFVNMGECRSAPPYSKKKTRHRSLFFRVFKFEKKENQDFHFEFKKRRAPFASLTEPEKKGVLRTRFIMGLRPKPRTRR